MLLRRVVALGIFLALVGCGGNAFRESYKSSLERWPSGEVSRLLPPTGKVEIVTSNDVEADASRMMENGYLLLGRSKFRSDEVNPDAARETAKDLGASVVLLKTQHAKTVKEAVPMERWAPVRRGSAAAGPKAIQGEYRVTYVQQSVDYYDFAATFWAKSRPPIFGVLVEASSAQATEVGPGGATQTGKGVVIRAVIADSPAMKAGIRADDVIVRFAGTEITDPNQFFDTVVANKGKEVEIEIVRPSEAKVIPVKLQLRNE